MTPLLLVVMALVFLGVAAVLTAAEAAFNFLPRHDAEEALVRSRGNAMRKILAEPVAHIRALRFWRIWFEMASAVAVAVLLYSLLDNIWLAGLAATGIMALVGFVIVGVSPRQLGRLHSAPWSGSRAPMIRFLTLGPGTHSRLAGGPGKRRSPRRPGRGRSLLQRTGIPRTRGPGQRIRHDRGHGGRP